MNKILIDNWSLQNAVIEKFSREDSILPESYQDLLYATVFWDKIYYPLNEMSGEWENYFPELKGVLAPYDDFSHTYQEEAEQIVAKLGPVGESPVVSCGALRYLILSNKLEIPYLPSPKRSCFIENNSIPIKSGIKQTFKTAISMNEADFLSPLPFLPVTMLDKTVEEVFAELNSRLGSPLITFPMPLLTDFIIQNCGEHNTYLDFAKSLHNSREIKEYMKNINALEDSLNHYDWKALLGLREEMHSLVNQIVRFDRKNVFTVSVNLLPLPSLGLEKDIPIHAKEGKMFHLTFLRNLAEFAFKGRRTF